MKDDLNCLHNGGGDVYILQIIAIHFNHTVGPYRPHVVYGTTISILYNMGETYCGNYSYLCS